MTSEDSLKRRLDQLADFLNDGTSVVPGAMERLRDEQDSTVVSTASRRFRRYRNRIAILTAAAALVALAFTWMKPAGFGTSLAFADVQEAIRQVETAVLTIECRERPDMSCRQLMRRDSSALRIEHASGQTLVFDAAKSMLLIFNKNNRTARLMDSWQADEAFVSSYLHRITNVGREATKPLGKRTIGNRTLVGFSLPSNLLLMEGLEGAIWVDPRTRLPVHAEAIRDDGRTIPLHMSVEFHFNTPVSPSLFLLSPPDDYELTDRGESRALHLPPLASSDPNATTGFRIEPGIGIGDIRFGMTQEQVVEALGRPDKIWDYPEHREVTLVYRPRGLEISVREDGGVIAFECSAECFAPGARPFAGHTTTGIGMGSSWQEIRDAYGEPDQKTGENANGDPFSIFYDSLGLEFNIRKHGVYRMVLRKRPTKRKTTTVKADEGSTPRSQQYWATADTVAPEWRGPSKNELQKKSTTPQAGEETDESRPRVRLAPAASGYRIPPDSHSAPKVTFASPSATNGAKPRSPNSGTTSDGPGKPVVDGGH
jgi:outer membrane lipoprotein-sorting protein